VLTMNSATPMVTSHNTEGLARLGGSVLTMNSATPMVTSHNTDDGTQL